jgi:regulator of protease activity HflC (stomatin/prohibitin superfamily)
VTYQVADVANYLQAQERLSSSLERTFCASAIAAIAGRGLDGVIATRSASEADAATLLAAGRRESLRSDIRVQMNRRLKELSLGIEVSRIDLTAALPARAKPAFDQVLTAEAEAARVVASARTHAEQYRQQGERDRTGLPEIAKANAAELVAKARIDTDRITALAAESSPEGRALLLTRLYRERMEAILHRAGLVTLVDGKEPVRLMLSGGSVNK